MLSNLHLARFFKMEGLDTQFRCPITSCFYRFDQSDNVYISEADRWSNLSFDHRGAGESWGRAGTGTQIGGSQESNMPLVNAIQPFAHRRRAWLYRGATAGSGAKRIQGQAKKKNLLILIRRYCCLIPWSTAVVETIKH